MSGRFQRLVGLCHRYGPGKLPRAEERGIGAGYACAGAALLAALTFAGVMLLLWLFGPEPLLAGTLGRAAIVAIPVVVPGAFVAGWATWTGLPAERERFGARAGAIAAGATYVVASAFLVPLLLAASYVERVPLGVETGDVLPAVFLVLVPAGFLLTFWLTVPLGAAAGYVHERARTATD